MRNQPHRCLACRRVFSDWWDAALHVRHRHPRIARRYVFIDELLQAISPEPEPATVVVVATVAQNPTVEVRRFCSYCGSIFTTGAQMVAHLAAAHNLIADDVQYGRDWYDDELREQRRQETIDRFARHLRIVDTVPDFLLECRIDRDPPAEFQPE